MSRTRWHFGSRSFNGIYRDRENGWLFGVCAGIAEVGDFRVGTIRIITLICLILFFWPTLLLYILATFLLREKPLIYSGGDAEYEFWCRSRGTRGRWSHS